MFVLSQSLSCLCVDQKLHSMENRMIKTVIFSQRVSWNDKLFFGKSGLFLISDSISDTACHKWNRFHIPTTLNLSDLVFCARVLIRYLLHLVNKQSIIYLKIFILLYPGSSIKLCDFTALHTKLLRAWSATRGLLDWCLERLAVLHVYIFHWYVRNFRQSVFIRLFAKHVCKVKCSALFHRLSRVLSGFLLPKWACVAPPYLIFKSGDTCHKHRAFSLNKELKGLNTLLSQLSSDTIVICVGVTLRPCWWKKSQIVINVWSDFRKKFFIGVTQLSKGTWE